MSDPLVEISIFKTRDMFSIVAGGKELLVVGYDAGEESLLLSFPPDVGEGVDLVEIDDNGRSEISLNVIEHVEQKAQEAPLPRVDGNRLTPLEEYTRDEIIEHVITSWTNYPGQTTEYTATVSHQIAEEVFGEDTPHTVMKVAGVRAALTRGVYDFSHAGASRVREHVLAKRHVTHN